MKYLADALTFFRFPAAIAVFVLIMFDQWTAAMIVLGLAFLSDALDGVAARRWPPESRWYRKDPHAFDNAGDSLLFFAALGGLVLNGPAIWDVIFVVSVVGTAIILFFIAKLRPSRAEKLDVAFGWCFGFLLFTMLVQITKMALWSTYTGFALVILYSVVTAIIIFTKWDRMTSRPEVTYKGTW